MTVTKQQEQIKSWFDNVYKTKGFSYLRPLEAYKIFVAILNPKPNTRHLDVACGLGLMLKALDNMGVERYGVDISDVAVEGSRKLCPDATVVVGNAEKLPYRSDMFDSLTCLGSLERMLNRDIALAEQLRVTKQGADICYMVRNSENFTWRFLLKPLKLYNKKGHQDALNLDQWKSLFENAGLEIVNVYPDQWPYHRLIQIFKPWKKIDGGKILKFPMNIAHAYEFIFHLKKK
jgi:SAM-dependent methyltransferase